MRSYRAPLFVGCILLGLHALVPVSETRAEDVPRLMDPNVLPDRPDLMSVQRLRFLTSLDFPPFNFADATRRPSGFNVDLARSICKTLEIEARCEIQAMPWEELQGALDAGRGDAIIAGTAVTAQARQDLALTRAYFRFPARFITKRPGEDEPSPAQDDFTTRLNGQSVAVVAGSAHAAMLKQHFPGAEAMEVDDLETGYEALKSDDAKFLFGDGVSLSFFLVSPAAEACCAFAGGPYMDSQFIGNGMAIAVRPDDTVLLQALEHALSAVERNGDYAELFTRYFPLSPYAEEGAGF